MFKANLPRKLPTQLSKRLPYSITNTNNVTMTPLHINVGQTNNKQMSTHHINSISTVNNCSTTSLLNNCRTTATSSHNKQQRRQLFGKSLIDCLEKELI